jgi:carbon-monoxide dehydrogenase medium subunit
MKPARFDYVAPASVGEAVSLLASGGGEAKILAGGQSLVPLLNMRLARPELVVDLGRIRELDFIRENPAGGLSIGAMTSKRAVEKSPLVMARNPMLQVATALIGHPQIRNRGTVGGSMAQADPAAEYPAVALAMDIELVAQGPQGERVIAAPDFFITYLTTCLAESEVLTEVRVPAIPAGRGWSFKELARRHGDFAMSGAAVLVSLDGKGCCTDTRIVVFAVGDTPLRVREAEAAVDGQKPSAALFAEAARKVGGAIEEPMSDLHASAEYRRDLAQVLTRRALAEAVERAR